MHTEHTDEELSYDPAKHAHMHEAGIPHTHAHTAGHAHTHGHGHHVHTDEEKKAVINRLARAAGHLNKVKQMVEEDADCSEVLIQLAAVRSAINNTGKLVLKNHISSCVVEAIEEGDAATLEALNHAIDQFMK